MSMIDLGDDIEVTVKYRGLEYKLREPSFSEIEEMQGKSFGTKEMSKLLVNLGMPEDVLKSLGASKIEKLVRGLVGTLTEKK